MGITRKWADSREIIMEFIIEHPWTWKEYLEHLEPTMKMLKDKGTPCATVVDVSKMGALPRDGNVIQILLYVDKAMPENVFASSMVGAPAIVVAFMNVVTKLRPKAKRLVSFTRTMEEAQATIYKRLKEVHPDFSLEFPTEEKKDDMSNQYDLVADQYDLSFQLAPYRLHIEAYMVFSLLGDVSGKRVIDLATGTGYYARVLKKHGASHVVGVDLAEQMVDVARMAEQAEPLGIEYHVQDVTHYKTEEPFDLALAVYLLHYAPTKEALEAMCQGIADMLKAGGRFITYVLNPNIPRDPDYYQSMGLNIRVGDTPADGEQVPFSVSLGGMTTPEVMAYRWEKATIEGALTKAGFVNITWIDPKLSAEGEAQHGKEQFESYLKQPHAVLITCEKG